MLEERFFDICRANGLPLPAVNAALTVEGVTYRPDFLWPSHRLVGETDGGGHRTPSAMAGDLERDRRLARAGYVTRRFSSSQVTYEPDRVAATLCRLLGPPRSRAG